MEIEIRSLSFATSTQKPQSFISVHQSIAAAKADPNIYNYGHFELARLIPSVIVPEYNVMLNPASEDFQRLVKLVSVEPFEFDPRLFPESAAFKSAT